MKLKQFIPIIFLVFASLRLSAQSQEWVQMMLDPKANFYDIQSKFNSYWSGKTIEKGKGYKAFRRWEYYMAPRVFPSGDISLPSQTYANYHQWEIERAKAGVPKSTSGNWSLLGPTGKPTGSGSGAGRVNFLRFDPTNSSILYIGTPDGGLWKSTNSGTTWTTNTDQLSVIGVSDLAIDPTNTQNMYLATGDMDGGDTYSIGVLKSTDGGSTWVTTGLTWTASQGMKIGRLLINPSNPSLVMAFTNTGIYRTTNGGATWPQVSGTSSFSCFDAEFKPGDPNTVYAAGNSIKRSTDGGATWTTSSTNLTNVQRIALAVTPANSAYVYVLATESTNNGFSAILKSTDSGATFTTRMAVTSSNNIMGWDNGSDTGGQGWYDVAIAASSVNAEEIYTGGVNIWKSIDGGSSFTLNTHWWGNYGKPNVHADIHDLQFLPGSGTTLFATCDGGIFKTTNSGSTYSDLSSNLAIAQQYRIGLSTSSSTILVSGHQDNGTNKMNGTAWSQIYGGDGMEAFIDRTNSDIVYCSYVYGEYYRSTNGGASWTAITNGLTVNSGSEEWLCAWHQDPVTATTLYAGGRSALYKTTDSGANWSALGTPSGTGNVIDFVIAPSSPTTIYAIKAGTNGVSKSTNGGTTFTSASAGLPTSNYPTCITVSNTDANVVFVTYSGYGSANKVYKSINGGTSWTNISTGLPNVPVNCIAYEIGSSADAIYIGTDVGVFYKNNASAWITFNSGLPNTSVRDLEIYYDVANNGANKRLRAATFGRGTWDSDLYNDIPAIPTASFSASSTTICEGQTVSFTNTSSGVPTSYSWSFPGGTPSTSTESNPTVTYSTAGTYTVELIAANNNGSNTSTQSNLVNVSVSSGVSLPLNEGFAGATFPPSGWTIINLDGGTTTWSRNSTTGNIPSAGNSVWFNNFDVSDVGNKDEIRPPKLDFTGLTSAQITFDVAYAAYSASNMDGLELSISTDCGATWTSIYNKTGLTVAEGNLPTAALQTTLFSPASNQWRTETVSLTPYIGLNGILLAFKNIAGYGNAMYIDNINITGVVSSVPPTASFTCTPNTSTCTGQTVQYTSTSTGSPTSYSWSFPGGIPSTSSLANPTVTYSSPGTFNVSLTATNALGSNTSSQTNYITVNIAPTITGTTTGSRCGVGNVTLSATSSGGTISWYTLPLGGTVLGTGTIYTTPSISVATTYYVEATIGECASTRVAVQASINPIPTVNALSQQNLCTGHSSSLISFTGSSSSSTYNWTNSNTAIGIATSGSGNIPVFTPNTSGIANITVTPTLNGCTGSPQSFQIVVNQSPIVTQSPLNQICIYGSAFTLTGGSPAGGNYSGIGVNAGSFNPASAGVGTYPITYSYAQNGCTGTAVANITVSACASIEEQEYPSLSLYPNPAGNSLTVEGTDILNYETLKLFDASGRLVQEWFINNNKMELDLTKCASGTYSLQFSGNNQKHIERVEILK